MPRQPRPARTYTTGAVTRATRIVALVGVTTVAAWLLLRYPSLPEIVPTHFGLNGEADDWGSKTSVLWLVGVMLALTAAIAALSTRPRAFNYPVPVTEQNAQTAYREGERTMVWMLAGLALVFAGLAVLMLGGGVVLLLLGLAAMVGAVLAGLVRLMLVSSPGAP